MGSKRINVMHLRSSGGLLGAENVILELAKNLPILGFNPIIGSFEDPAKPVSDLIRVATHHGIETVIIPCKGRFELPIFFMLGKVIREKNIGIVHSHGYKEDFYTVLGRLKAAKVATNHLWKRSTKALTVYAKLDGLILRCFDHVVAVSEEILQEMIALGINKDRISKIPNGVDLNRFEIDVPQAVTLKASLGISDGAVTLGTVGSLTTEKGHVYLLRAFAATLREFPGATLVIIGEGSEEAGLKAMVKELGIGGRVIFTGKRLDVPNLLMMIDIFVLPSLKEGLPMALLEAMAAKKAVIASAVGEIPTVIVNGHNGLMIPPCDSKAIENSLCLLLGRPDRRGILGRNARRTVEERYSARRMTEAYCKIYERILSKNGTRGASWNA